MWFESARPSAGAQRKHHYQHGHYFKSHVPCPSQIWASLTRDSPVFPDAINGSTIGFVVVVVVVVIIMALYVLAAAVS